ncbi:acetoacetate--CoA ligase [Nocardia crassostreae]|uniref:acetoacetate--CoA ligase n=1 Tax=Nocardia crassostreae TaxID=53428 RepID=UPI00083002A0|nr:acetoacetate--CoA ligase [Nocardia crassostreae]
MSIEQGEIVWTPPADVLDNSRVGQFLGWLREQRGLQFGGHEDLWRWSVTDLDGFWSAIWEFGGVISHAPYRNVLAERVMPGTRWFPGALLNYAEHAMGLDADSDRTAVLGVSQTRPDVELTFGQLRDQVARARAVLASLGVGPGDRVAGYLPNAPETLIAFLATASLGAIWASCAPEFGPRSVIDRFAQLEPAVLLVAGGYSYGDKEIDRRSQIAEIRAELPSVRHVADIWYGAWRVDDALDWPALLSAAPGGAPEFLPVPFDHPLFVLFSSGTTGKPKAIVHGHGGILLEHLKNHTLSWDMGPQDRMLWFTTTAWMMWNALVSGLLTRSSIVMIDGNPMFPDVGWQWRLAERTRATIMGASPGFVMASRKAGLQPGELDLPLRVIGSAGAPLPPEGYAWIRDQFGPRVHLNVGSGGTDVCSGLVQNNPLLPVRAGEISGRCLGVDAHAFDESGGPITGALGELVITSPMPSMPVAFWNDPDDTRLRSTYFDRWPGIWRHGDWIRFDDNGSCHVAGRSDATLNRGGVRLGTAEFYRVVEEIDGISDSLVVHLEDRDGGNGRLLLFVSLDPGTELDTPLRTTITRVLRTSLSPRHIPDEVHRIPVVPRNLTGKKLELPAKRILLGAPPEAVTSPDALSDPTSLHAFVELAAEYRAAPQ